ncbi:MAG: 50S ribosomal protein L30 [Casimicrobiaceae bacterium]
MADKSSAGAAPRRLRVTLVRGLMGKKPDHRATVRGLGLRWRSHTVEVADTPEIRGMIGKIGYMLAVTEAKP